MNDLARLFASMREESGSHEPDLPPSVQAKRLATIFKRYVEPCPFKPGELVTPFSSSGMRDAGSPHIVLEVIEPRFLWVAADAAGTSSNAYGRRIDMRVGSQDGNFAAFWVESFLFEPWTGDIAA